MTSGVNFQNLFLKQPGYLAAGLTYLTPRVVLVATVLKMLRKARITIKLQNNQIKEAIY